MRVRVVRLSLIAALLILGVNPDTRPGARGNPGRLASTTAGTAPGRRATRVHRPPAADDARQRRRRPDPDAARDPRCD